MVKPHDRPHDPLTVFLYILLRDHLTAGEAEEIVRQVEACGEARVRELTNEHVAAYASELSGRLTTKRRRRGGCLKGEG